MKEQHKALDELTNHWLMRIGVDAANELLLRHAPPPPPTAEELACIELQKEIEE